jgi:hypothetical protein
MLILVFIVSVIDTFVGRWYARTQKILVTSKKTRTGFVSKMIYYTGGLVFVYLLDRWILNDMVRLYTSKDYLSTAFTALFLIWIEYSSIDEKVKWVKGKGITDRIFEFIRKAKKAVGIIKDFKDEAH